MNVEAMRATITSLKGHAKDFDMDVFIAERWKPYRWNNWRTLFKVTPCGTSCCFAGEAYLLAMGKKEFGSQDDAIYKVVCNVFDITKRQADRLFYVWNWPHKFSDMYEEAGTGLQRVEALEARVEEFIKRSQARQKRREVKEEWTARACG